MLNRREILALAALIPCMTPIAKTEEYESDPELVFVSGMKETLVIGAASAKWTLFESFMDNFDADWRIITHPNEQRARNAIDGGGPLRFCTDESAVCRALSAAKKAFGLRVQFNRI